MTQEQGKALEDASELVRRKCGQGAMFNALEIQKILRGLLGVIKLSKPDDGYVPPVIHEVPVVSKDTAPPKRKLTRAEAAHAVREVSRQRSV